MTDHAQQGPATGVTAHLTVSDAAAAIDFYKAAFGATEFVRLPADDGKRIMHAHLGINGGSVMLNDEFPEYHGGVTAGPPSGVTLHLQVDDADAWHARAVTAGATSTMAPEDMFWGDRYGEVRDPFGHKWAVGSPLAKV